jgi:hypothetical protein
MVYILDSGGPRAVRFFGGNPVLGVEDFSGARGSDAASFPHQKGSV